MVQPDVLFLCLVCRRVIPGEVIRAMPGLLHLSRVPRCGHPVAALALDGWQQQRKAAGEYGPLYSLGE